MPKRPLSLNDFLKIVRENAIATDAESASNLHRVLSHGRTTHIAPETFSMFYEAFRDVQQENEGVDMPGLELEKGDKSVGKVQERVLAVTSSHVRTNFNIQSVLVLTTYRLLAVTTFKTYVMADLRKAIRFDKCDCQVSILGGVKSPGIRVEQLEKGMKHEKQDTGDRKLFTRTRRGVTADVYVGFANAVDRDNWYHMVVEMQIGRKLSLARKDPGVVERAECHVILQNAVNQSGLLDRYNYCQRIKDALVRRSGEGKGGGSKRGRREEEKRREEERKKEEGRGEGMRGCTLIKVRRRKGMKGKERRRQMSEERKRERRKKERRAEEGKMETSQQMWKLFMRLKRENMKQSHREK